MHLECVEGKGTTVYQHDNAALVRREDCRGQCLLRGRETEVKAVVLLALIARLQQQRQRTSVGQTIAWCDLC